MNTQALALTIAQLKGERRKLDERIETLTEELRASFPRNDRIDTDRVVAFWRCTRVPEIQDLAAIPDSLFVREPDRKRIGSLLRRGKAVPGAQLVGREILFVYPPKEAATTTTDSRSHG
jgi:hypothetical protein